MGEAQTLVQQRLLTKLIDIVLACPFRKVNHEFTPVLNEMKQYNPETSLRHALKLIKTQQQHKLNIK